MPFGVQKNNVKVVQKVSKKHESLFTKTVLRKCPSTTLSIKTMLRCSNQGHTSCFQGDATVTAWSENNGKENNYKGEYKIKML